ncbi:otoferlin-like [Macrosteles quadrilineatus]|uniref:otoferlin-like n=1 Tax=Macrosteles quadrilineatus TaxID=74068 RepID=UPI0023E182D1|nr:otoferlin-like [Macrosteles quadrilineatus]
MIGVELVKPLCRNQNQAELHWLKIGNKAQILSVFEIVQINAETDDLSSALNNYHHDMDPDTISYRLEVAFWGIRPVDVSGFNQNISQAQVKIQCSDGQVKSSIITQTKTSLNFQHDSLIIPLSLPRVDYFSPPLTLEFTSDNFRGCTIERNINQYKYDLPTKIKWEALNVQRKSFIDQAESRHFSCRESELDSTPLLEIEPRRRSISGENIGSGIKFTLKKCFDSVYSNFSKVVSRIRLSNVHVKHKTEEEEYDWWLAYFSGDIKVYDNELENQEEFSGFNDVLKTFMIKKQKEAIIRVKTMICLYKWPSDQCLVAFDGHGPDNGVLTVNDLRDQVKLLIRVYFIRAYDLHPSDPNGLADPFIEIKTNSNCISDKSNYIAKQLDPVFGRCLEIPATLPTDSILTIRVMDWDMLTASDLIGETTIDIENRFYSKHRATCGLPKVYSKSGLNSWRDVDKPTDILQNLCHTYNLPPPMYCEKSVLIGSKEFILDKSTKYKEDIDENLALLVLNKWSEIPVVGRPLVPQHVETRALFVKDKTGLERGKLELWVDLFDRSSGEVPHPVDIKPRKSQEYELRVVILNTARVPLVDDSFFVGKKHTDIFVKGWLWDTSESQITDIHYTSINGSGNFNWRFIFPFSYLKQEKRMVISKKDFFRVGKAESKVPALLYLQVWDSDRISPDDFIGAMVLELCKMPRGATSVRSCKPKRFLSPSHTVDLFKVKRLKGWWPFFQMSSDIEPKNAGFLEAEFHLLTKEEALFNPAGLGRAAPNALPAPLRPSVKIKFWLAPFRAVTHYVFGVHKGKCALCVVVTAIVMFLLVGIYSVPLFIVKRMMDA